MCEITIFLEIGKIGVFGKKVKIGENGENRGIPQNRGILGYMGK